MHAEPTFVETPSAASRDALRVRLESKIAAFETSYGFTSTELKAALASGQVADTAETCDWLIAWETVDTLTRAAGPTRLE